MGRYWVYQIARACQALRMATQTRAVSEVHGRQILMLEQLLGIDVELGLQELVMTSDFLLVVFNKSVILLSSSEKPLTKMHYLLYLPV